MPEVIPLNLATSTLAAAVTSAGQTTITLQTGDGAKFNGSGTYRVILWNNATSGPWEICTVTGGQGTDVLTVTRASEAVRGVQTAYSSWAINTNVAAVITDGAVTALLAAKADLTAGFVPTSELGSGTANASTFLRGDQSWAAAGGGGGAITSFTGANSSGVTIPKGALVAFDTTGGNVGGNPLVVAITSSTDPQFNPMVGVASAAISNGATGTIIVQGLVSNVDTSAFAAVGDSVYAGATAGSLVDWATQVNTAWFIGYVVSINATTGSIFVIPQSTSAHGHAHSSAVAGDGGNFLAAPHVGGLYFGYIEVESADYTVTPVDGVILVNASGAARTITLPLTTNSTTQFGQQVTVIKTDSSGNAVTVQRQGVTDTINGVTSMTLASQYSSVTLFADVAAHVWRKIASI